MANTFFSFIRVIEVPTSELLNFNLYILYFILLKVIWELYIYKLNNHCNLISGFENYECNTGLTSCTT